MDKARDVAIEVLEKEGPVRAEELARKILGVRLPAATRD
jgi:hypothetical protein